MTDFTLVVSILIVWKADTFDVLSQGCQIGFFDGKFHKTCFFKGSWRQKKLFGLLAFSFQYLTLFGSGLPWHTLSGWCFGFLYNTVLRSALFKECYNIFI